jgi:hypothetical protein
MSHVVSVKIQVKSLDALKMTAVDLGLEFLENKSDWRWWLSSVGDYPLPEGFTANDLKKSLHVLRVPNDDRAYDVGVFKSKTHEGYELLFDFYGDAGRRLESVIGSKGQKLVQGYSANVAKQHYKKIGWRVTSTMKDGKMVLKAYK